MLTDKQKEALIQAACQARDYSYAPYSQYKVGAALLSVDDQIIIGANVENASYGLSMCAERTAVFKAVSQGIREIKAIAVCTSNAGSPCGACRQVLSEFAGDIPILMIDDDGNLRTSTLHTLLPDHFAPEHLQSA